MAAMPKNKKDRMQMTATSRLTCIAAEYRCLDCAVNSKCLSRYAQQGRSQKFLFESAFSV